MSAAKETAMGRKAKFAAERHAAQGRALRALFALTLGEALRRWQKAGRATADADDDNEKVATTPSPRPTRPVAPPSKNLLKGRGNRPCGRLEQATLWV
jgi:hypothetical protein